jgi:hypothetical protein
MAFIFHDSEDTSMRGRVQQLVLPDGTTPASIVTMVSPPPQSGGDEIAWGGFTQFKSMITNLTIAEQTNHQFRHMVGSRIYAYNFGDRIGTLGVSGVASYDNCGIGGGEKIGIAHVLDFYRQVKMNAREEPLKVTIAPDTILRGFLYRMRGQVLNVEQRLFQFYLDMALIPEQSLV